MTFFDDLAAQLAEAERRLAAEAEARRAGEAPSREAKPRRRLLARPVLVGAVMAVLATAVFVGVSLDDRATPVAEAGLEVLSGDGVPTSVLPRAVQQREIANARTAHPFDTPNGTGYAFLSRALNGEQQICATVPEEAESEEIFQSSCKPRAEAEQEGLHVALVPTEPKVAIDVVVLPVGVATLTFEPAGEGDGPRRTYPSVNGVVAFEPTGAGTITWRESRGSGVQRSEVNRAFPRNKLRLTCRDGRVIYGTEPELRTIGQRCRGNGGVRELMGVLETEDESAARAGDRSGIRTPPEETTPDARIPRPRSR